MKTWMVETQALKVLPALKNPVKALDGVDLSGRAWKSRNDRKFGSGKSTLLHMLGGLDTPTSGEVFVDEKELGTEKG